VKLVLQWEGSAKGRERMLNECYTSLYMFKCRYDCMNMVSVGHSKHIWLNRNIWLNRRYVLCWTYVLDWRHVLCSTYGLWKIYEEINLHIIITFICQALHMIVMFI